MSEGTQRRRASCSQEAGHDDAAKGLRPGIVGAWSGRTHQSVLIDRATLAVMPTGAGKSLCSVDGRAIRGGLKCVYIVASSTHRRSEQAVRGVPTPDASQDLGIVGDARVTEAGIKMALVGRGERGVEASIEKEWDSEVPEPMVPLIGCFDASGLRDAGSRHPVDMDRVE